MLLKSLINLKLILKHKSLMCCSRSSIIGFNFKRLNWSCHQFDTHLHPYTQTHKYTWRCARSSGSASQGRHSLVCEPELYCLFSLISWGNKYVQVCVLCIPSAPTAGEMIYTSYIYLASLYYDNYYNYDSNCLHLTSPLF